MREIKFRGKDIKNNKWIYGGYYSFCETTIGYGWVHYIIKENDQKIEVKPATVGQFTGLHDKNGIKIYEGDIVSYNGSKETVYFDISLRIPCFTTGIGYGSSTAKHPYVLSKRHEVVGNIHENPELLRGK